MAYVQADVCLGERNPKELAKWQPQRANITRDHLEIASAAWQAYREPTPQAWFKLLARDLSLLPRLRHAVLELLGELPWRGSGLNATQMWMLDRISGGNVSPSDIFTGLLQRDERDAFHHWEIGELLDGLARCPMPVVSGLDEGPFSFEMYDNRERRQRYHQSKLSLTPFGKAVLAGTEDFSRHNPIHRWWGGTELTNDRLWRWERPTKR